MFVSSSLVYYFFFFPSLNCFSCSAKSFMCCSAAAFSVVICLLSWYGRISCIGNETNAMTMPVKRERKRVVYVAGEC